METQSGTESEGSKKSSQSKRTKELKAKASVDPIVEQLKTALGPIIQPLTSSVCQLNGAVEKLNGSGGRAQHAYPKQSRQQPLQSQQQQQPQQQHAKSSKPQALKHDSPLSVASFVK